VLTLLILSLIADFTLPLLWAVLATLPIAALSRWIAYWRTAATQLLEDAVMRNGSA
jgi:hypothetical protein